MKKKLVTAIKILIAYILIPLTCVGIYIYVSENHKLDELYAKKNYLSEDSLTMFWHIPNMNKHFDFEEYAPGGYIKRTNNLGFVKNRNTEVSKDSLIRIIITGDSHTDGVLPDNETFPNLMEDSLNLNLNLKANPTYELLNAGMGNFTFKNYYGVLKKFLYLKPDIFIINVYTGNDFIENIFYEKRNLRFFNTLKTFWARLKWKYFDKYMNNSQSLAQAVYFKVYPEKISESISLSNAYVDSMASICKANNIRFYVSFLPTAVDVEDRHVQNILSKDKYTMKDILVAQDIKQSLINRFKQTGIATIDLLPEMKKKSAEGLYYKTDDHINPAGHRAVARILTDSVFNK